MDIANAVPRETGPEIIAIPNFLLHLCRDEAETIDHRAVLAVNVVARIDAWNELVAIGAIVDGALANELAVAQREFEKLIATLQLADAVEHWICHCPGCRLPMIGNPFLTLDPILGALGTRPVTTPFTAAGQCLEWQDVCDRPCRHDECRRLKDVRHANDLLRDAFPWIALVTER